MLNILNQEHFDVVKAEAEKLGLMDDLQKQLDYLATYANHGGYGEVRCNLGWDFAPLSFSFTMQTRKKDTTQEWKHWFSGGLIFHSGKSWSGGAPAFSVELCPSDKPHWSVHT